MLKRTTLLFFFSLSVVCCFAQLKKANTLFNNYEFANAIPLYAKVVKRDSNIEALQRLADSYRILKKYQEAEDVYAKVVQRKDIDPLNFFYYGIMLRNNNKLTQAREQLVKYAQLVPADKKTEVTIQSIDDIKIWLTRPPHFEIQNVQELNTTASEFCPFYYKNKLAIAAERTTDLLNFEKNKLNNQPFLDVFQSLLTIAPEKIIYSKLHALPSPINTEFHDGPISIDTNNTIYVTRVFNYLKGEKFINYPKIFIASAKKSDNTNTRWEKVKSFPYNSDSYTVEHPSISADGKLLFFASDMPGSIGGKDIWLSRKNGDSWGKPENLGAQINTIGNELFPSLRKDGILYFSSDGHPGFGGLDIFSAKFENNKWTNVTNQGLPLNSPTDDFGITFSDDFQNGYFSSNRSGGIGADDIYSFIVTNKSIDVSGRVLMSQQLDDPAPNLKVFLMTEDGTVISFTTSDSLGFFKFENLSPDLKYLVKMDESDPLLKSMKRLFLADSENKIHRVTVINDKGDKFVFQSLPFDQSEPSLQYEGSSSFPKLSGSILFGEDNRPLANSKINLLNEAGEIIKSTITNNSGAFVFSELQPDQKYFVKLDETDVKLPSGTLIKILSKKGEIVGTAYVKDKGFKFELLPSDQINLTLSKEENSKLKMSMSGKLLSGIGNNKPLKNIKVNLLNERGDIVQTTYTDADGNFKFAKLPPDRNFSIKIDEGNPSLAGLSKILLADEKGKVVGEMNNSVVGFKYEFLSADNVSLSLMSVDDLHLKFSMKGKILNGDGSAKPVANIKVNLLNETGNSIQTTYTDSLGNFSFSKLQPDQNYFVSIDETDAKFNKLKRLLLADASGKPIRELKVGGKGGFKYALLASDFQSHTFMQPEDEELRMDMFGKLLLNDKSGKGMANKKIRLVNEKGEVVDSTTTDTFGYFEFKNLPSDKKYLVKLENDDSSLTGRLKLVMTDKQGNITKEIVSNKDGSFQYELLSSDKKMFSFYNKGNKTLTLKGRFEVGDSLSTQALANSLVSIYDTRGKLLQKAFTDKAGQFYFLNLLPAISYFIKMDEKDAKLLAVTHLALFNERGDTLRNLKGNKANFKFELLPSDLLALSDEAVDDSWNKLQQLGKKLLKDTVQPQPTAKKPAYGYGLFANLYYDLDKYDLSQEAKDELMKVVVFINETPGTIIELQGYTDIRSDDQHNMYLSDLRARAAKRFLVQNGINVNRVRAVAFGKSNLVFPCSDEHPCTEEQHAQSRRVEIKVIYRNKKNAAE